MTWEPRHLICYGFHCIMKYEFERKKRNSAPMYHIHNSHFRNETLLQLQCITFITHIPDSWNLPTLSANTNTNSPAMWNLTWFAV